MSNNKNLLENYQLQGEKLKIFTYPATVLSQVATPVQEFNHELEVLCQNMLYTMYHAPGIGLAAPQIGISKRIFVIDISYDREEVTLHTGETEHRLSNFSPLIFINPIITPIEGEILYEEGCLSLPGQFEEVKRVEKINVDYQDLSGNKHSLTADGLLSVCLQHENDHLDGIVFIDRLSFLKKEMIKKKILKEKKIGKKR